MSLRKSLRKYTHWFIELNVLNTYTTNRVICCFNTSRAFGKFTLWRSFLFFEVKSSKNDNSFVGLKAAALTGTNGERISARIRWPFNPLFADACQEKLNMQRVSRSIKCLLCRDISSLLRHARIKTSLYYVLRFKMCLWFVFCNFEAWHPVSIIFFRGQSCSSISFRAADSFRPEKNWDVLVACRCLVI